MISLCLEDGSNGEEIPLLILLSLSPQKMLLSIWTWDSYWISDLGNHGQRTQKTKEAKFSFQRERKLVYWTDPGCGVWIKSLGSEVGEAQQAEAGDWHRSYNRAGPCLGLDAGQGELQMHWIQDSDVLLSFSSSLCFVLPASSSYQCQNAPNQGERIKLH